MIYKLQNGGIIKLQNAGSLPKGMQKLNSWSSKNIPQSDESIGERIQNKTIEEANSAKTQEERDKIYKDSAKTNLAVTGQSLMMLPMLGEFTTYGLLGGGLRLGTGMAGSKTGEYVLGKGGDGLDKQLHTKFLGTTGRIVGGLGGGGGGSSATTPLFRNLAGKGITLHMPQETFMNLRGQYFDRAAKNIKLDASTLPKLQYRDRLTKDYLEFGPDSNIYGDNVSKLVHGDPMTTGARSALPINGGFNVDPIYFPHFENGKLVPAIGQIRSKLGNGQMYEHPYHPIFFGGNKPGGETPGSNFSDQYIKQTTFNKSKFTGPKQYYDRGAKTERRNLRNLRNGYTKYGPQNKSDRYLITDPENLVDYEFSHKLGIMGSEVPMSKLEGFEYDPLLGTFKRAKYIDPSTAIISPQEAATTYHFDGRIPFTKPMSFEEKLGGTKGKRNIQIHGTPKAPYYDYSLINRNYEPGTINEKGEFVFESPEKSKKLASLHFSLNEPVISHFMGSGDDAPTTVLLPYRNIRSKTPPVDIAIMDTFFPNYNGLKISSRGSKILTGDRSTFDYYKSKGLDVEFNTEMESLINELKSVKGELDKIPANEKYGISRDMVSERAQALLNRESNLKTRIDEINRSGAKSHAKQIPSFEKLNELGKAEGLDVDKYPYSLGTPKKDGYGRILPESSELNYNGVSDPSNHSVMLSNPEYLLESINRGEYEVTPEYKRFIEGLVNHKADYREVSKEKHGGIIKFQKAGVLPKAKRLLSIAEKLGIPKGDRGLFDGGQISDLHPRFNKGAEYYGYDQIPESVELENAVDIMRNTFKRHNTFFRGVHKPSTPEDIAHIESLFGKDYNLDDVYKYVATHGRPGDNAVFVSPLSNAGIYGSTGKTAIVRRRFKLGRNPETGLQDADFDIIFGGSPEAIKTAQQKGTLTFPGNQRGNGIVENELLAPDGTINFIDFVPSNASTSYFDSNGSLNKYLGYKSFGDVYGFGDYNHFTDIPVEKPKFKQGGKI